MSAPLRLVPPRAGAVALALVGLVLTSSACTSADPAPAPKTPTTTKSTPPEGSGATLPGITATSLPAIVPTGASQTALACRRIYPAVTDAVTAWNAAGTADAAAVRTATTVMSKAAADIPAMAKDTGDAVLVRLTDVVATQLKALVADYTAGKDVDGAPLTKAENDLWAHCQAAR